MTVREKAELIVKDIKKEQGTNPVVIFKQIAEKEYISIHGPEHHILDGMEGIPYVKPWKTVLVKRGAATVLYLVVAFVVAGIVELLGKI